MCLQMRSWQFVQPRDPCLKTLTNAEAVEHLWSGNVLQGADLGRCCSLSAFDACFGHRGFVAVGTGPKAVARRILSGCIQTLCAANISRNFVSLQTDQELQAAGRRSARPTMLLIVYSLICFQALGLW